MVLLTLFLSAMSRARASRDLNQLFCFVKLGCLSEFWFVYHLFTNLENISCLQISPETKYLTFDSTSNNLKVHILGRNPFRAC